MHCTHKYIVHHVFWLPLPFWCYSTNFLRSLAFACEYVCSYLYICSPFLTRILISHSLTFMETTAMQPAIRLDWLNWLSPSHALRVNETCINSLLWMPNVCIRLKKKEKGKEGIKMPSSLNFLESTSSSADWLFKHMGNEGEVGEFIIWMQFFYRIPKAGQLFLTREKKMWAHRKILFISYCPSVRPFVC